MLLCVHHFVPAFHPEYFLRLPQIAKIKEVFNTDREEFGGSGKINEKLKISKEGVTLALAPLATQIFEVHFEQ